VNQEQKQSRLPDESSSSEQEQALSQHKGCLLWIIGLQAIGVGLIAGMIQGGVPIDLFMVVSLTGLAAIACWAFVALARVAGWNLRPWCKPFLRFLVASIATGLSVSRLPWADSAPVLVCIWGVIALSAWALWEKRME